MFVMKNWHRAQVVQELRDVECGWHGRGSKFTLVIPIQI